MVLRVSGSQQTNRAAHEFTASTLAVSDAARAFDGYVDQNLDQVHALEKQVSARDNALLYHDAKRDALQSLLDKPPKDASKKDDAQRKFDEARAEYEKLNANTKRELSAFSSDPQTNVKPELHKLVRLGWSVILFRSLTAHRSPNSDVGQLAAQLRWASESTDTWSLLRTQMA